MTYTTGRKKGKPNKPKKTTKNPSMGHLDRLTMKTLTQIEQKRKEILKELNDSPDILTAIRLTHYLTTIEWVLETTK